MNTHELKATGHQSYLRRISVAFVTISLAHVGVVTLLAQSASERTPGAVPAVYVADFVSTAAYGVAINDVGDVTGTSYPDLGCGSFCLPPLETVVWRNGARIVLPSVPGFSGITVTGINNQGWISGFAGVSGTTTHAVVWQPIGTSYIANDVGTLPGTTISSATGIDNQERMVGWSTTAEFPPNGSPFLWSPSTGMVDLSAQGFPDDIPLAISPAGTVATPSFWYELGNPGSVQTLPPPPTGFFPPGTYPSAINDAGDQARFLVSTSAQSLVYPFRLPRNGAWQQISSSGTGSLSTYGIGSINAFSDITATVLSTGMVAPGPSSLLESIAPLLSSAYPGASVGLAGPMNASGQVLAQVMIGNSARLMRLTPATSCSTNCAKVTRVQIRGKFVQDPNDPGHCSPDNQAYNKTLVKLTVTDENGLPLAGVLVSGRFLDNYWTDDTVSGTTDARGHVQFSNNGPCGVGTVTFLVDSATLGTRSFDRTTGILTASVIPR